MNNKPPKAIIFDMDGLLFDTESAYSVVQTAMAEKRHKPFTIKLKNSLMGKVAKEVILILIGHWGTNEDADTILKEQDDALIKLYKESVQKLEGFDELFSFINKNNIRICIGTSSRAFLVDVLLNKFNLTDTFEFVISGDMITKGKPDPEIYTTCVTKLNLQPNECIVIEDSLNGIKAGTSAGCITCAIPSIYTKDEDFSLATLICTSLNDPMLLKYLNQNNN